MSEEQKTSPSKKSADKVLDEAKNESKGAIPKERPQQPEPEKCKKTLQPVNTDPDAITEAPKDDVAQDPSPELNLKKKSNRRTKSQRKAAKERRQRQEKEQEQSSAEDPDFGNSFEGVTGTALEQMLHHYVMTGEILPLKDLELTEQATTSDGGNRLLFTPRRRGNQNQNDESDDEDAERRFM